MNTVILCGRLTADPKSGQTQNGKAYCNFSLAVNNAYSKDKTDFIDIVAWNTTAQNCSKYLSNGSQILVNGSLTTETYEKDGIKRKQVKVLANNVEFLSKGNTQPAQQQQSAIALDELEQSDMPFRN